MTIAAFILGLLGTLTGCLALWIQWLSYRRDSEKLQFDLAREQQASEPFFKWLGGGNYASAINRVDVHREFVNEGGAITRLEIKANNDIQASISPKDHLGEGEEGKIEFSKFGVNHLPDAEFEISYTTKLNKRFVKSFVWPKNSVPKEKDASVA